MTDCVVPDQQALERSVPTVPVLLALAAEPLVARLTLTTSPHVPHAARQTLAFHTAPPIPLRL